MGIVRERIVPASSSSPPNVGRTGMADVTSCCTCGADVWKRMLGRRGRSSSGGGGSGGPGRFSALPRMRLRDGCVAGLGSPSETNGEERGLSTSPWGRPEISDSPFDFSETSGSCDGLRHGERERSGRRPLVRALNQLRCGTGESELLRVPFRERS